MKGLLLKDLKLMTKRKQSLVLMLVIAVLLSFNSGPIFILGYLPFVVMSLALGTISYDELDNGFPFLFTLPVSRKSYVQSKYLLLTLSMFITWVFGILIVAILCIIQNISLTIEHCVEAVTLLPLFAFLIAIMLPLHLKYGVEKIRTVYMLVYCGVAAIVIIAKYFLESLNVDTSTFVQYIQNLNIFTVIIFAFIVLIALLIGSYFLSVRIVNKFEL